MADPERIHIVIAGNIVMGAYRDAFADSAELHKRCITGASVVTCELLSHVPREILDDLNVEWDADADEDTPVDGEFGEHAVAHTPLLVTLSEIDDERPKRR